MVEKYWNYYTRTKYELLYFYAYLNDSHKRLKYLDSFLAVVSSGSVAAWAVWNELPMLWAVILAASQVINAVKQFLPYGKRIQALNELIPRLDAIVNRIDHAWFKVNGGVMTEEQVNDLIYGFRKECTDLSNKYLAGVYFPERKDLGAAAENKAECFFECFYEVEEMKKTDVAETSTRLSDENRRNFVQVPSMHKPIPMPKARVTKEHDAPPLSQEQ